MANLRSPLLGRGLLLCLSLVCGICTVCHGVFAHPFSAINRLCSVSLALPGHLLYSLGKHAYSNILKILPPKTENFQIKKKI